MKKLSLVGIALLTVGCAHVEKHEVHWGYAGAEGPEHWGTLKPEFATCGTGKNQSPVDIKDLVGADLQPIRFTYRAGGNEVLNNGHTIQVNYAPGSSISVGGHVFELKQFHFHAPSENQVGGRSYPLEAHLVHADRAGNLAVVGVMFVAGKENQVLARAWAAMPEQAGVKTALTSPTDAEGLLPRKRAYYRYSGSLTTPPCSEGVLWLVMKDPVTASKAQIEAFEHVMHHPNNRPVQPANARAILK